MNIFVTGATKAFGLPTVKLRQQFFDPLAHEVGKKTLFAMPDLLMRLMMGAKYPELIKSYRVSNERFKAVSSWRPEYSDLRQSLSGIHQALQHKQA
ncbi:hypothetical protein [Ktedonospora formicarum]|uniref:Uncharacterized protein n=1 Tax=Ktedonospora formicarum TaxID=2778364 RepID=A0A8J3IBQ5_9CHLR|nr:hypothetical protein [Ktedonospora formicarum]GHO51046.1 hypothetical protein KSX_92090 [Ktedonospora formicarum]